MSEHPLPMFDNNYEGPEPADAPKKARRKPSRVMKHARKAARALPKPVKKRRKRRAAKAKPVKEEVFLSDAVYKTIRTLVDLNSAERGMVFAIVKGLTK